MMAPHADLVGMTIALRVHHRRRARARVRGDLRRRQPRQRARRGRRCRSRRSKPSRPTNATAPARRPRRGRCRELGRRVGLMSASPSSSARARRRAGRAALRRGRDDRRARPASRRRARRRGPRRGRAGARAAARQRPHPRGDDALPRLRRRPAADAVAGGADLAGRGEARGRRRLLGHAARLPGDDPLRHHPLLGHVLAPGGDRAGGRRRRDAGDDRRADVRQRPRRRGDAQAEARRAPRRAGARRRPRSTAALAPHSIYMVSEESLRFIAELSAERGRAGPHPPLGDEAGGRRLHRRARPPPRRLPRRPRPAHRARPCSPTASGSTTTSST